MRENNYFILRYNFVHIVSNAFIKPYLFKNFWGEGGKRKFFVNSLKFKVKKMQFMRRFRIIIIIIIIIICLLEFKHGNFVSFRLCAIGHDRGSLADYFFGHRNLIVVIQLAVAFENRVSHASRHVLRVVIVRVRFLRGAILVL